ncbi:YggT family protein [Candidatus Dojkabacteria bacterium]|uniref:YggT family protein n=1 Tax=Candidatus Dojkabacteria bacterium TaxID=2099670 RepID=A0A952AJI2_9BACT|nr:YggT family protein [Candidatus Dojkabacteria bacterium]
MNSALIRAQIKALVFGIFGIAMAIVLVRIILVLVGANPQSQFVIFWMDMSNFLVGIFRNMYPALENQLLIINIELFSFMALVFYMLMAVLIQKSFASFTEDSTVEMIKSFIDSMFKFLEFLLIARFLLKLTGAAPTAVFTNFIYSISALVYEPFKDILPAIEVKEFNIIFESSTLIAIIIIIIFDLITEGIIDNLRGVRKASKSKAPAVSQQPVMVQSPQPNVTINIPAQPMQPQVVDRRQIHIVNPPAYSGPGYGTNHLEGQRPQQLGQGVQTYYPQNPGGSAPINNNSGRREA